jgi:Right handed beta helix region
VSVHDDDHVQRVNSVATAFIPVATAALLGSVTTLAFNASPELSRPPAVAAAANGPAPDCTTSLQSVIDKTPTGGRLVLPNCTFRGAGMVDRPMSIVGSTGTEITGLDVWRDWAPSDGVWVSAEAAPIARGGGECRSTAPGCSIPVEVFVDRAPLSVSPSPASAPAAGFFAVRADGRLAIPVDPAAHLVEVAVRSRWLDVRSADVSVAGVSFFGAANEPQAEEAAVRVTSADRFSLADSTLRAAHGALLGVVGGSAISIVGNRLLGAGQEAFGITRADGIQVSGNVISGNNTAGFDPEWEAGGGKATRIRSGEFTGNTVSDNAGPGLWCDIGCSDVAFSANRISGNERAGILFEVSTGGRIERNALWSNGWGKTSWGWGAAILVSTSGATTVTGNVAAWNADGITVIRQDRADAPSDAGHSLVVSGNTVVSASDASKPYLVAWLDDGGSSLFSPSAGNRGDGNRFWAPAGAARWAWNGDVDGVAAFASLAGGTGSVSLDVAARDAALAAAGVPIEAPAHSPGTPDAPRIVSALRSLLPVAASIAAVAIAVGTVIVLRRRRSKRAVTSP